jgi:hypothetical protein
MVPITPGSSVAKTSQASKALTDQRDAVREIGFIGSSTMGPRGSLMLREPCQMPSHTARLHSLFLPRNIAHGRQLLILAAIGLEDWGKPLATSLPGQSH